MQGGAYGIDEGEIEPVVRRIQKHDHLVAIETMACPCCGSRLRVLFLGWSVVPDTVCRPATALTCTGAWCFVDVRSGGWSTAFRRTGPAEAGTPNPKIRC